MAMNDPAPRRELPLGAIYLGALVLVFLGERVVVSSPAARYALTGLGLAGLVASTALRASAATRGADADRKKAERTLLWLSLGGLIGVGLYFLTTDAARTALGIAAMSPDKRARVDGVMTVAWIGAVLLSALPLLLGELALAPMRRAERIEARRVRSAIRTGVTLALAGLYCALFTFAAGELDLKLDYSYFRTSKPSESTRNIAASASEPVEVTAFFPELNDVGAEVESYLRDVGRGAPNLKIAFYDRLLVPQIAKDKKVTTDGTIVLTRGPSRETVNVGADMKTAGTKLKNLDQDFQKALLRVIRESRVAYLTVGHGEINESGGEKEEGRTGKLMRQFLERQNYVVKDLGLTQGLAVDVPSDAGLVMVLGPKNAFQPEEVASLQRYADKGGHLLLALDPEGGADLGALAGVVGLTWSPTMLANDRVYVPAAHQPSDHAFIGANRFSSHASVSTLSRLSAQTFVIFIRASSLDKKPGATEKIDFAVKSMPDTFQDKNQNYALDPDEKRSAFNLAAAVTKPGTGEVPKGKGPPEMRAFVVADADCFDDLVFRRSEANQVFAYDVVRWLGGEESFAGAITTNEDVRIEHTKQKDVLWFYATIFGVPGLIGGLGVWRTRRRKNPKPRAARAASKKKPAPK
ncbi:MAG TPA: Gldg family protein, partial [Minicystis sp.]|nr:Gldg family protein [Minicystis sp.]